MALPITDVYLNINPRSGGAAVLAGKGSSAQGFPPLATLGDKSVYRFWFYDVDQDVLTGTTVRLNSLTLQLAGRQAPAYINYPYLVAASSFTEGGNGTDGWFYETTLDWNSQQIINAFGVNNSNLTVLTDFKGQDSDGLKYTIQFPFDVRSQVITGPASVDPAIDYATVEYVDTEIDLAKIYLNVADFGTDPSGVNDSTFALQAAITQATQTKRALFIPAGRYKITQTLVKPSDFYCPNFLTEGGGGSVIFDFSSLASGQACLELIGGSAALNGTYIEAIQFEGNATTPAILIDGQCGIEIRDCHFKTCSVGIDYYNRSSGSFAEYAIAVNCHFDFYCATAMQFRKSADGTMSFHGSGMRNCYINDLEEVGPNKIIIGAGVVLYNSPFSAQIWKNSPVDLIKNEAERIHNFHGAITIEGQVGFRFVRAGDNPVAFCGTVQAFGGNSQVDFFRGAIWCDAFITAPDASSTAIGRKITATTTLVSGLNNIPDFIIKDGMAGFVDLVVDGPNYLYHYTALITSEPFSNRPPTITLFPAHTTFNASGIGAPAITIDDTTFQLAVSNASYSSSHTVQARWTETSPRRYYSNF